MCPSASRPSRTSSSGSRLPTTARSTSSRIRGRDSADVVERELRLAYAHRDCSREVDGSLDLGQGGRRPRGAGGSHEVGPHDPHRSGPSSSGARPPGRVELDPAPREAGGCELAQERPQPVVRVEGALRGHLQLALDLLQAGKAPVLRRCGRATALDSEGVVNSCRRALSEEAHPEGADEEHERLGRQARVARVASRARSRGRAMRRTATASEGPRQPAVVASRRGRPELVAHLDEREDGVVLHARRRSRASRTSPVRRGPSAWRTASALVCRSSRSTRPRYSSGVSAAARGKPAPASVVSMRA